MTLLAAAHRSDELDTVGKRMGKWVNRVLTNYQKFCPAEAWTPCLNLYEDKEAYIVVVDLSGVKGPQIDVRIEEDKGVLLLSGTREIPELPAPPCGIKLLVMEIDHGPFCRTLDLPEDAAVEGIEASYRSGMLTIHIPRK